MVGRLVVPLFAIRVSLLPVAWALRPDASEIELFPWWPWAPGPPPPEPSVAPAPPEPPVPPAPVEAPVPPAPAVAPVQPAPAIVSPGEAEKAAKEAENATTSRLKEGTKVKEEAAQKAEEAAQKAEEVRKAQEEEEGAPETAEKVNQAEEEEAAEAPTDEDVQFVKGEVVLVPAGTTPEDVIQAFHSLPSDLKGEMRSVILLIKAASAVLQELLVDLDVVIPKLEDLFAELSHVVKLAFNATRENLPPEAMLSGLVQMMAQPVNAAQAALSSEAYWDIKMLLETPVPRFQLLKTTLLKLQADLTKIECTVLDPPESSRTYSSVRNDDRPGVSHARSMLSSQHAWTAGSNAQGEWMALDLGRTAMVRGTIVQGSVTSYKVKIATEYESWYELQGGPVYANVQALFPHPVLARYVLLEPLNWTGNISMRAAMLQCESRLQKFEDDWRTIMEKRSNMSEAELWEAREAIKNDIMATFHNQEHDHGEDRLVDKVDAIVKLDGDFQEIHDKVWALRVNLRDEATSHLETLLPIVGEAIVKLRDLEQQLPATLNTTAVRQEVQVELPSMLDMEVVDHLERLIPKAEAVVFEVKNFEWPEGFKPRTLQADKSPLPGGEGVNGKPPTPGGKTESGPAPSPDGLHWAPRGMSFACAMVAVLALRSR